MPLYDYFCPSCGESRDLVRPIGHAETCAACGFLMKRSEVHHTHVIGPTVNTLGQIGRATEFMAERDYLFDRVEQDIGEPIARPNDWAVPKARAREMVRRGEIPEAALSKSDETMVLQGHRP